MLLPSRFRIIHPRSGHAEPPPHIPHPNWFKNKHLLHLLAKKRIFSMTYMFSCVFIDHIKTEKNGDPFAKNRIKTVMKKCNWLKFYDRHGTLRDDVSKYRIRTGKAYHNI